MFEKKGKIISKSNEYNDNKKRSRKFNIRLNPLDYGKGPDSQLNNSEKFKVECFFACYRSNVISNKSKT